MKDDHDVYKQGITVGFADEYMNAEEAEEWCRKQTYTTGIRHDWHFVGGRILIKAMPAAGTQPREESLIWQHMNKRCPKNCPYCQVAELKAEKQHALRIDQAQSAEMTRLYAKITLLEEENSNLRDCANFWIDRGRPGEDCSPIEYSTWLALGYQSRAMATVDKC